ncbi:hypothetical protein K402DRAFT_298033, partial [Aulographum hederae CBS 113979]
TRATPSRPTTPLRPVSRNSLRDSTAGQNVAFPLDSLEAGFAELSDGMADLEANFMHLQLMHESLSRFSESFASFLYGMNMNAFCVDFPEAPIPESFKRLRNGQFDQPTDLFSRSLGAGDNPDPEATFLTTDTSFVENPPTSSKPSSKFSTPAPSRIGRGGAPAAGARGAAGSRGVGRTRGSGLARASARGAR